MVCSCLIGKSAERNRCSMNRLTELCRTIARRMNSAWLVSQPILESGDESFDNGTSVSHGKNRFWL